MTDTVKGWRAYSWPHDVLNGGQQHNLRRLGQTGTATPPAATIAAPHGRGATGPPGILRGAYRACSLTAGPPVCGDVAHFGGRTVTFRGRSVSCV
jgi:hypothetical protein